MTTDFDRETDEKCEVIRINWINPEVDLGFDPGLLLNRIWIQSKNPKSVEAKNLVWTRLNELNRVNPLKKLYFEADIACSIAKQDLRRLALLTFVSRDSIVDQSWFLGSVGNFVSRTIITGGQSSKVAHFLYGFSAGFGVCGGRGGGATRSVGGSSSDPTNAARAGLAHMRRCAACERPKIALL